VVDAANADAVQNEVRPFSGGDADIRGIQNYGVGVVIEDA